MLTVASKNNHNFRKTLGADRVFDYKNPDWIEWAAAALMKGSQQQRMVGAYDCISSDTTMKATDDLLACANATDALTITISPPAKDIHGKMDFGTDATRDDGLARAIWHEYLPQALADGRFLAKPDPLVVAGKGLEGIQGAMDVQRRGVSARKVVVSIA